MVVTAAWIAARSQESAWVEERRTWLVDLGWFMKSLKEPVYRRADHEDKCSGTFSKVDTRVLRS